MAVMLLDVMIAWQECFDSKSGCRVDEIESTSSCRRQRWQQATAVTKQWRASSKAGSRENAEA